MNKAKFEILFLEEALKFLNKLEEPVRDKVLYNIDKSRYKNDPKLFKKLEKDIWEFRTNFAGIQYRLLAFWSKGDNAGALVIATHGIVKKTDKVPVKELERASELRRQYLLQKN